MSNNQTYFFIFSVWMVFFFISSPAQKLTKNESRQEKLRASVFFDQKNIDKAIASYEKLLKSGYFSEKSLYELASLYEAQENWLEAAYILKKIQYHYGSDEIAFRLAYLEEEINSNFLLSKQGLTELETVLFRKQKGLFFGAWGILVFGFFGILGSRRKTILSISIFSCSMAFLLSAYLAYQAYIQPTEAVLMEASSFYAQPSYAATRLNLPLEPGQSIQINSQQDIWFHISQGPYEGWVPFFVVKKLIEEQ